MFKNKVLQETSLKETSPEGTVLVLLTVDLPALVLDEGQTAACWRRLSRRRGTGCSTFYRGEEDEEDYELHIALITQKISGSATYHNSKKYREICMFDARVPWFMFIGTFQFMTIW